MTDYLEIDGSEGEGGGQVLRTSLGLSLCTGRAIVLTNIRSRRKRPGLLRQHLTAVRAATAIGDAVVSGDALHSRQLIFEPRTIQPGSYRFSIGTAGSTTLVLQAVLPALLCAPGPTELTLEGGTHNPWAPPFDFLERAYLPLVSRMGPLVRVTLERPGFHPAGGGKLKVFVTPAKKLKPLWLDERGEVRRMRAVARVAALPTQIGHRELRQVRDILDLKRGDLTCEELPARYGPGNVVFIEAAMAGHTEVFTAFGQKGVRAEKVGKQVARETKRWLEAGVPVGQYLADQLIPLLALAGGGSFVTLPLSRHARTQAEMIPRFLDVSIRREPQRDDTCRVVVE